MKQQTLGATIAALRKERGMTQLELANQMGVTDKAVSKWERDLSFPDAASLPKLAETLGVSVDELMQGGPAEPARRSRAPRSPDPAWGGSRHGCGGDRSFRPAPAGRRGSLPHAGPGPRLSGSGAAGPAGTVKHIIKATQKALHRVMQSLLRFVSCKKETSQLYEPLQ